MICDCCGAPATCLSPGPVENVLAPPKATRAEVYAAPRERAQWCERCVAEYERWRKRYGMRSEAA